MSRKTFSPLVFLGGLLAVVSMVSQTLGQLPATQLTSVFPPGGKLGTSIDVTVTGADLDDLKQLFFSHPGIKATQKMTAGSEFESPGPIAGQFKVEIAADIPPGIYEARVSGRYGVSNPRAFSVGVYEEAVDGGGNNSLDKAMPIAIDSTTNGRVDANSRDYFKLSLKQGERVFVDCRSQRIDSRLNATMVLLDANGKELVRNLDSVGLDPLIDFTAPSEGDYYLSLYDFVYRGGNDYFYRLTVHLGPHIDFIFPPSGLAGSTKKYTLYGRNLPDSQPAELTIGGASIEKVTADISLPSEDEAARRLALPSMVLPRGSLLNSYAYRFNHANSLPVYFARSEVVAEQEPNNDSGSVQTVTVPCEVVGQFFPARDVDWIQFEAKKGDVYHIDLFSHRLGFEVDSRLMIQKVTKNDKGEESVRDLANVDDPGDRNRRIGSDFDTSTDDPSYRLTADEDAIYRVMVFDQFGASRSDPRAVYRLAIRHPQPDFRLVAVPQSVQTPANGNVVRMGSACVRPGGTTMFAVRAERIEGFDGEIAITVEGLPAGVTTRGAFLGSSQSTASLIFEAAEDAADWGGSIRIVGKAMIGDAEATRYARGGAVIWGTGNRQQDPPMFRATRDIAIAVLGREGSPTWVEVGENKVWETSLGGKLEIPVTVKRRRDFKGDLKLAVNGLPNELKQGNVTVKGNQGGGKFAFNVTNSRAKPGVYTFFLRADTKGKFVRNADAVPQAEEAQKRLDAKLKELDEAKKQAAGSKESAAKAAKEAADAIKPAEDALKKAAEEARKARDLAKQEADKLAAAAEAASKEAENQELADAVKSAEKAKAEADKKSEEAAANQTAAEKSLADARARLEQTTKSKAEAERASTDAENKFKQVDGLKKAADKRVADLKKANAPKDVNFVTISTPVRVRIVKTPLKVTATAPENALAQGATIMLPVKIERLYGFADKVDVSFEIPKGVAGIATKNIAIAKDQGEGTFEIAANDSATVGGHTITVRAKAKFNNVNVEAATQLVLEVEPKPAEAAQ